MTIIVSGTVDFSPADAAGVLADSIDLLRDTRRQAGCLDYVWSADPATPGRLYVYERWDSEAALAAHLAGRCYTDMATLLHGRGILAVDVQKHRIDRSGPVYDAAGVARADFFEA